MSGEEQLKPVWDHLKRHDRDIGGLRDQQAEHRVEIREIRGKQNQLHNDLAAMRVEQRDGDRALHKRIDRFEESIKGQLDQFGTGQEGLKVEMGEFRGGTRVVAWLVGILAATGALTGAANIVLILSGSSAGVIQ